MWNNKYLVNNRKFILLILTDAYDKLRIDKGVAENATPYCVKKQYLFRFH